ncbi:hypothetical protein, partial [Tritonibacter mobilis]|uniref:hypothetical protein n=1 Tax=Tritonibacter mobilis TaxID=379347 RepID=UPI0019550EAD
LGLGGGLGGVGEALMREIAGLCLVDRLLWGFVRGPGYGADRAIRPNGSSQSEFGVGQARF